MTDNERFFRIVRPDRCWHKWTSESPKGYAHIGKCACGREYEHYNDADGIEPACSVDNPDFAHSDEIATAMMEAGLWEEFIIDSCYDAHGNETRTLMAWTSLLMDTERLKKKIIAWREGK